MAAAKKKQLEKPKRTLWNMFLRQKKAILIQQSTPACTVLETVSI